MATPKTTHVRLRISGAPSGTASPLPYSALQLWQLIHDALDKGAVEAAAFAQVAGTLSQPVTSLQRQSSAWSHDQRQRLHTLCARDDVSSLAWLLAIERCELPHEPTEDPPRYFGALCSLLGGLPELRFQVHDGAASAVVLALLLNWSERLQGAPWILEGDETFANWLSSPPNSRTKTLLRFIQPAEESASGPEPEHTYADLQPPTGPVQPPSALDELDQSLAQAHSAVRAVAACPPQPTATEIEVASQARSQAELALYRLLQTLPETRDRFALNVLMPFAFGNRPAELDLYSAELAICIEVDGPHHFISQEAYRRDRRKDALLQRHGIWVWRVLAEDVVERTDEVASRIRLGVKARHQEDNRP